MTAVTLEQTLKLYDHLPIRWVVTYIKMIDEMAIQGLYPGLYILFDLGIYC